MTGTTTAQIMSMPEKYPSDAKVTARIVGAMIEPV